MRIRRTSSEGGLRAAASLMRRNRDFRRLYLAQLISLGGDWFLLVVLLDRVLQTTGSSLATALLFTTQEAVYFVASPLGGHLADRVDRRVLMVTSDIARAAVCAVFLFLPETGPVLPLYVLISVVSGLSAGYEPAAEATVPNIVSSEDLSTANALTGSAWGMMLALGASLGGIVTAKFGAQTAIIVDIASFVLSGLLVMGTRAAFAHPDTGKDAGVSLLRATAETLTYARQDRRVLSLVAVKFGWGLAGGVLVMIPVIAQKGFNAGQVGLGLLFAARGVGAVIGPFVGRSLMGYKDRRIFLVIGVSLAVFGFGYLLLGLATTMWVAVIVVCLAHTGGGAQWMLSSYGLKRMVPDRIMGRVFAFDGMLVTLTFGLSSLSAGLLSESFGPRVTLVIMGGVALVWACVWLVLTGRVRRETAADGLRSIN